MQVRIYNKFHSLTKKVHKTSYVQTVGKQFLVKDYMSKFDIIVKINSIFYNIISLLEGNVSESAAWHPDMKLLQGRVAFTCTALVMPCSH